jgi:Cu/Ag efflux protein CusF
MPPADWLQVAAIIEFPYQAPQILLAESLKLWYQYRSQAVKILYRGGYRMKKLSVVLVVVLSICLVVSMAFAMSHVMKGAVKSVDAKAGSIVVTVDGKDMTFKAGKDVDVAKFKAGDKVEVTTDKDVATDIKAAKKKAPVGC